jgi:hypothetical protein
MLNRRKPYWLKGQEADDLPGVHNRKLIKAAGNQVSNRKQQSREGCKPRTIAVLHRPEKLPRNRSEPADSKRRSRPAQALFPLIRGPGVMYNCINRLFFSLSKTGVGEA